MTKEEFITERTRIISEMLDNPDENDIYPTSRCFTELDLLYDKIVLKEQQGVGAEKYLDHESVIDFIIERNGALKVPIRLSRLLEEYAQQGEKVTDEMIVKYFTQEHYHYQKGRYTRVDKDRIHGAKCMRDNKIK